MGRLLAVSDLHGCLHHFIKLLNKVKLTKEDTLVILGDFIDRGPESKQLVDLLINLKEKFPKTVILKGNHEQMFLDWINLDRQTGHHPFLWNGGRQTLNGYGVSPEGNVRIPGSHIKFLRELPLFYETEQYLFVHAGINPDKPFDEQTEDDLLWIRDEFLWHPHNYHKVVVHGHSPTPLEPSFDKDRFNLDNGGVFGNEFWLADFTNKELYKIPGYVKPILPYSFD